VLLITCCSAKDNAVGTRVVLRRPRGVIRITQGVIDKAGFVEQGVVYSIYHRTSYSYLTLVRRGEGVGRA
jgi:hypothetical protein